MNLSVVSVYDNVNCGNENFSKSNVYRTINDLLNINGDVQLKLYCPLCVHDFEFKFSLFEHLKKFHNSFLIEAGNQNLTFKECPFCEAKFYGKHLTAKHALLHHSKVIKEIFVAKDKLYKCCFCNKCFGSGIAVVKHIEKMHFLDFEEEFSKKFSCNNTFEVTVSELLNSSARNDPKPNPTNQEGFCFDLSGKHERNKYSDMNSTVQDFNEASKVNCYDFTDLKEQLEKIKEYKVVKLSESDSAKRPILKDVKNSRPVSGPRRSVRRVLRFDLPDGEQEENKENSVLQQNLGTLKQINHDEHNLLCQKEEISKHFKDVIECSEPWYEVPKHSSTPNSRFDKPKGKILSKDEGRMRKSESNFKSYLYPNKSTEFEFQCGKCRKLFKENLDLVCHIKHNHKRLGLKALQPCYRCAICSARFFKNHYLRKHHRLHNPY